MKQRAQAWLKRNEFAKHVLVLISGTALSQAIGVLSLFILPHLYSQADIGVYSVFNTLILSLVPIVALRYDLAIVLPDNERDAKVLTRTCMRIVGYVCLTFTAVGILFMGPISRVLGAPSLKIWICFAGASLFLLGATQVFTMWLTRTREFGRISRNRVNQSISTAAIQIGLPFAATGGVTGLVLGTFGGQLMAAAGMFRAVKPHLALEGSTKDDSRRLVHEYRKMPLVNGPNLVIDFLRTNGINFLILRLFGDVLMGQFAWALRITQTPLGLINGAITQVFYQKLSITKPGAMLSLVRKSIVRSAILGVVPFGLLFVLSPWFFSIAMPAEWNQLGVYVQALTPWLFMNLITSPISNLFLVIKRQLSLLIFSIVYAGLPLAVIAWRHVELLETIQLMSAGMSVVLIGFLVLALWESKRWDALHVRQAAEVD